MTPTLSSADDLAQGIVDTAGKRIVLGLPVGIGKSILIANALFRLAARDPSVSLQIFSGLTLEVPVGRSDLETRFIEPLAKRLFDGWPTADYLAAHRSGTLPANIDVREFYLRPGAFLGSPSVQQSYTSLNYSHVVRELRELGVNVIAQLVARRGESPDTYSLSSNPEITLDLLAADAATAEAPRVLLAAEVHNELPFMTGDAEVPRNRFDFVLQDPTTRYPLFPLPNRRVASADYSTAMHVASVIPDGGTLQLGIGSLSDAVAHCLLLRHKDPALFARVLSELPGGSSAPHRPPLPVETDPFSQGLYASSELLSDALFALFEGGVVSRRPEPEHPVVLQAGFFIGSATFYRSLRELTESARRKIRMTRISEVNTLFGDEQGKRHARRQARFINETMIVTLLGAAVSDALEDGRVVSGVGGQFDFVAMGHELADARSILMVRARRERRGGVQSNIRWRYGHTTVPRHYRDLFVSEYGIAATRGCSDREVIAQTLNIADSQFQTELLADAKQAGKIDPSYSIPSSAAENLPNRIRALFQDSSLREHFPEYPLGSEMTATERRLLPALEWLESRSGTRLSRIRLPAGVLFQQHDERNNEALSRMNLAHPSTLKERILRRLLERALDETGDRT
ncbi:MAG: acetyl-CoA hydrolase/transferase C-terminal domain-containing protein [Pseudomonadota bacterium]